MFISDLFEATTKQTLVLIPGGFHPFHPGHLSLYRSAEQAFPGATIVYVATDDQKDRPFPFADKQRLAQIAGVKPDHFQLVRSPFVAKEVTEKFDPNNTVLIFARSEKDRNEHPKPGGVKKDGSPSYLQPYTKGELAPMSEHGYMAYLPTVQFDAGPSGVTSATQIRNMWPQADDAQKNDIVTDLYPKNPAAALQILNKYLGGAVAEGFEPGHREIERWATQSEENQKIYNAYIRAGKMADEAYKQNDGASYTGLQLRKKQIRDLIAKKMSEQGVAEGLPQTLRKVVPGYAKREIDKKMDAGKFGKTDADKDANFQRYKKIQDKLKEQGVAEGELDEKSVSQAQFRTMAAAAHNPEFAKKVGISTKVAKEFHKADKKQSYKSLPSQVKEDEPGKDPNVIQLKKRAKVAHPFAQSDEEALALYINDREIRDVDNLEREQNRELRMINRIEQGEEQLAKQIQHIDQELAKLIAMKSK